MGASSESCWRGTDSKVSCTVNGILFRAIRYGSRPGAVSQPLCRIAFYAYEENLWIYKT